MEDTINTLESHPQVGRKLSAIQTVSGLRKTRPKLAPGAPWRKPLPIFWFECKHCKIHDIVKLKTENFVLIRSGQMTRTKHWQRFNRKNANTIKKS